MEQSSSNEVITFEAKTLEEVYEKASLIFKLFYY